ncbi:SUMO ligase MMS21 [Aspergillus clavatus NRRL 1]|uniref:Chromosomal organization and DNA repair protein Mms21, putative n=1 Tax=Aspergillus clavatus (strain ATCC 1007 / CBS 513.65 / DSM 816 / NCTC 3887 / NRRL 1 / QM 1276 / 107) TaxID=344612 RepID=A1CT58_ASPCL|nr:chromosomal organization and DNA repair protein Mms21, putative [Aspergillus clavatus NRRL 1]EAW06495.1 chromosomal organization and DNA repair protein Mms21, putative [Aspergillus clavatus NRRL 1]
MSTSTPRTHRPSHPPHSERRERTATARPSTPPLPAYEPPSAPLNATAQNELINLLSAPSLRQLKSHVQRVEEKLADSAGEVNERLTDARVRYQKEKARKRKVREGEGDDEEGGDEEGDGDGDGEELERLARLEERVKSVTEELEGRMRRAIDAEVRVEGMSGVLTALGKEAEEGAVSGGRGRRGARGGAGRTRRTRRRRRDVGADGDDDGSDEEDDEAGDEEYEATPEHEDRRPTVPPSRRLVEQMDEESARWENQSLTQRYLPPYNSTLPPTQTQLTNTDIPTSYSTSNTYIGFYRIVHEAKHPGDDIPPLPHASTWFSHLEDPASITTTTTTTATSPTTRRTRQHNHNPPPTSASDSDDIAIERERISLKCPLTLLPFRDPVTSTKCPHSFERAAIDDMITQSSTTVAAQPGAGAGAGTRGRRVRAVKCPVCSVLLTVADLRADPVLLRRVRRAEAASQREAEDEEFDEDGNRRRRGKGGRKSGITVGSDDEDEDADMEDGGREGSGTGTRSEEMASQAVQVKQERALSQAQSTLSDEMDDAED